MFHGSQTHEGFIPQEDLLHSNSIALDFSSCSTAMGALFDFVTPWSVGARALLYFPRAMFLLLHRGCFRQHLFGETVACSLRTGRAFRAVFDAYLWTPIPACLAPSCRSSFSTSCRVTSSRSSSPTCSTVRLRSCSKVRSMEARSRLLGGIQPSLVVFDRAVMPSMAMSDFLVRRGLSTASGAPGRFKCVFAPRNPTQLVAPCGILTRVRRVRKAREKTR